MQVDDATYALICQPSQCTLKSVHEKTGQEVIILKSPISLKFGTKVEGHEQIHVSKYKVNSFLFSPSCRVPPEKWPFGTNCCILVC